MASGKAPAGPSLERFIDQLSEIAPRSDEPISSQSHLLEDLGFDFETVNRLATLLYRSYGIVGISMASLIQEERVTVEAFFQHCVLDVLGVDPADK